MTNYSMFEVDKEPPTQLQSKFKERRGIGVQPSKEEPESGSWRDMFMDVLKGYFGDEEEAKIALTKAPEQPSYDMDEALETLKGVNLPSRVSEPVIEGVPEKPEMGSREPFELEVDTIGNEALDRDGVRLVDVTDTEEGKLSNEEALFEMGKQIRNELITTSELPSGKGLMSPVTDDDMGLPSKPSKVEELKDLYSTKGPQYKKDQIVGHSYINDPLVEGGVRGKSRVHGDASIETQNKVIDSIVAKGREADLSDREIALVLAIAKHESGFNPDAAAGTTSARGLGQFVNKTGKSYGITKDNQWDLDTQIDALIAHTKDNMDLAKGKDEAYVYAYHHDGPSLQYGGLKISKDKVMPLVDKFEAYLKSKGELQEPDYPDQSRETSPRPMLRPDEEES